MSDRKNVNKYYPPNYDPTVKGGSLNAQLGQHPLRARARKLDKGILVIRFEMPWPIWCENCNELIGKGVRFNAEKRRVGNYYTTPLWAFAFKCTKCKVTLVTARCSALACVRLCVRACCSQRARARSL